MSQSEGPIIQIQKLVKTYGLMPVLRKLDLEIQRGQFVALLGPNGSGKSTLIRLLTGNSRPTAGRILIGGWDIPAEAEAVRHQIGLVSHKTLMYDTLSARENLQFFAELYELPRASRDKRIDTLLEQVGLAARANDLLRTFSRGMQQRLMIARALLHDPHILLFDEPYTGLDQAAAETLDSLLLSAREGQHTIIMATHQMDRAAALANRVVILSNGKVAYDTVDKHDTLQLATTYAEVTGMASAR